MTARRFYPLYPGLWEQPGEKCLHEQRRRDRITLVCARLKGHTDKPNPSMAGYHPNHLHDVPPELQIKEVTR